MMKNAMKFLGLGINLGVLLALSACSITPTSIVQTPMTAKPIAPQTGSKTNGAIFNQVAYRPLFEDRKPRYIGDLITITIAENTTATKSTDSASTKKGAVASSITSFRGLPVPSAGFTGDSSTSFKDTADANASNAFTGSITATVVDVLANGNLVVAGEKQISLDKGTEFVRVSGVVNPDQITQGNQISSAKVADARIEYRTNSKIDAAELASIFGRFFLSIAPL